MISIARIFGAPVIDPPGNMARITSTGPASSRRRPSTLDTRWWTFE